MRAPWSQRRTEAGRLEFAALREGVPDGLLRTLTDFVLVRLYVSEPYRGVQPRDDMHDSFARRTDRVLPSSPDRAVTLFASDRDLLLDVLDFVLEHMNVDHYANGGEIGELQAHLDEARSAYKVGIGGDGCWELQHRQPPEVTEIVDRAASGGDRSAEHLRRAWSKLYRRSPDYNGACLDAVAAVEVVAKSVVSPGNSKTTLGTILRDLRAKPSKWATASEADADVDKVIVMLELIWQGHYRHGNDEDPIDVSEAGAVMVVQLAAVLVGWFNAGYIQAA